jgi:hypothetical protein
MRRAAVVLPHGLQAGGLWLRTAELRELNGSDEEQIVETRGMSPLARSMALLERVVTLGAEAKNDNNHAMTSLTMGDVTALALQVRKLTFGDVLQCVMACPSCAEEMSVDLALGRLLLDTASEPATTCTVSADGYTVILRPVTGDDLLGLGEVGNEMGTPERVVKSCVVNCDPPLPAKMSDELLAKLSSALCELDPQADLLLDLTCPSCKHRFEAPFFPEDFLLREIDARRSQLEMEVHWLAFNYGWSEKAILSLPISKRKRYVELINQTLSGARA